MGRTLHFDIKKDNNKNFTRKELEHIYNISEFYNSDELLKTINETYPKAKLKEIWSCENFFLSPVDYHPNWHNSPRLKNLNPEQAWTVIDAEQKQLESQGLHYFDVVDNLHKQG